MVKGKGEVKGEVEETAERKVKEARDGKGRNLEGTMQKEGTRDKMQTGRKRRNHEEKPSFSSSLQQCVLARQQGGELKEEIMGDERIKRR